VAVTVTLNSACNSFLKLVSKEQHHTAHVSREITATAAKYLSSYAEKTFNGSRAGQSGACLDLTAGYELRQSVAVLLLDRYWAS